MGFNSRYASLSGFYPGLQLIRHGPPQQPGAALMAVATVAGAEEGDKALGVSVPTAPYTGYPAPGPYTGYPSAGGYPAPGPYSVAPVAISPTGYAPVATAPVPTESGVELTAHVAPAAVHPAPNAAAPATSGGVGALFGYPAVQKREF